MCCQNVFEVVSSNDGIIVLNSDNNDTMYW